MSDFKDTMQTWWDGLATRERRVVIIGGALVGFFLVYAVIWSPLTNAVQDRKTHMQAQQQVLSELQNTLTRVQQLKDEGVTLRTSDGTSLLTLLEQTLSTQNLLPFLTQVQTQKENQVSLTFQSVPFDSLMKWIENRYRQEGVRVSQFSANRLSVIGKADVRLTMMR